MRKIIAWISPFTWWQQIWNKSCCCCSAYPSEKQSWKPFTSLQKLCLECSEEEHPTPEQCLEILCSWLYPGRCVIFMSYDQLLSTLLRKGESEHKLGKRCSVIYYLFMQPEVRCWHRLRDPDRDEDIRSLLSA